MASVRCENLSDRGREFLSELRRRLEVGDFLPVQSKASLVAIDGDRRRLLLRELLLEFLCDVARPAKT
ncbi:hypothetical protein CO662_36645 [Rhizobium anhuiense]|uniref:Uncharacterized protein n=1 Tax=Rhizobium anhuiense TaxID=1184720 RepID=A0ABX4IW43_9HYPH|nr:hypothetical protein CO668_18835 [Rhizobium anhuiense]PDS45769.1 hypothetical protein CO662_36645 [Rhizobium anhuiense]